MENQQNAPNQTTPTQTATAIQNIATACVTGALSSLVVPGGFVGGCVGGAVVQTAIEVARPSVAK